MKTQVNSIALQNNSMNAKTLKKLITTATLSILSLTSCTKNNDDGDFDFNTNTTTEVFGGLELENAIQTQREDAIQTFTIDGSTGGLVIGDQGTQLNFPPGAFEHLGGEPVTGPVEISLMEIYGKADMLKKKLPTNGKQNNGDVSTIVSGGEFFIDAKQNGERLRPTTAFELTAPTDGFDTNMTIFVAENCDQLDCDVVWDEDEEADVRGGEIQMADGTWRSAYIAPLTQFGWTNLDRWWSFAGPKTLIKAKAPEGFDDTNSSVYISYDGEANALALLDVYNPTEEVFSEHYGLMPIGQQVHFIFVSVQNGDYVYAIQGAVIGEDHLEVIGTTQTTTEAGLTALINALP